jgi:hypothetical protein
MTEEQEINAIQAEITAMLSSKFDGAENSRKVYALLQTAKAMCNTPTGLMFLQEAFQEVFEDYEPNMRIIKISDLVERSRP